MKKGRIVAAVLILVVTFLVVMAMYGKSIREASGPSQVENSQSVATDNICDQLVAAEKVLTDTRATMAEQYEEAYFETDDWKAFVEGYWSGFWEQHQYCKTCSGNGNVPN